jgi:peptidyl-tRNA hydrolase
VLTRSDLPQGQQATQSVHAAFLFSHEHVTLMDSWFEESSYLVLLGVQSEAELQLWKDRLEDRGCVLTAWHEPDLDGELTSVAVAPSLAAERCLSSLPLLLREVVPA